MGKCLCRRRGIFSSLSCRKIGELPEVGEVKKI